MDRLLNWLSNSLDWLSNFLLVLFFFGIIVAFFGTFFYVVSIALFPLALILILVLFFGILGATVFHVFKNHKN